MNKKELRREIKKLEKFIQLASIENPFNLTVDKEKLESLREELKNG